MIQPFHIVSDLNMHNSRKDLDISIVVPIYNEEENIQTLYDEISTVMQGLNLAYEIILVDDGSTDDSLARMSALIEQDPRISVIKFSRNFGQTAAMSAGFRYCVGRAVITLDADLQNDPKDIPRMLEVMRSGFDVVAGWRKDRQDPYFTRILPSRIANGVINWLATSTRIRLHDHGCTLKIFKLELVKKMRLYGDMHRFLPVFAAWLGAKVTEVPVHHRPRLHGTSKYNLSRVTTVILDLISVRFFSDFFSRPIQFFGRGAKLLLEVGLFLLLATSLFSWWSGFHLITPSSFLILLTILIMSVFQILFFGVLAELNIYSYYEGHDKEAYIVERVLHSMEEDAPSD